MGAGLAASAQLACPSAESRHEIRRALTSAPQFAELDQPTRQELAHSLVRIAEAVRLLEQDAGQVPSPQPQPAPPPPVARALNAGSEFSGTAVDRVAGATRGILQAISFPRFVAELINGVFKAILDTNQQQLQQYLELIRGVSQSLEGFASLGGDDDAARRWLAERFPGSFAIEGEEAEEPDDMPAMDGEEEERDPLRLISVGAPPSPEALRAALSLEADAEVPSGGGEALVPFVRRALSRNRQGMLATMIQMGMQRIVIDSGKITAGMRFHIDATSAAQDRQTSAFDTRHSVGASASAGFGWFGASASLSSTIGYVRTSDTTTSEDLTASADLNSSVELNFRTDQVPLDRLASRQTQERLSQNSLNPSRETELMLEAERAREQRYAARETARAARQPPAPAPGHSGITPPAPPALDTNAIADRARAALGGASAPTPAAPAAPAPAIATPPAPPAPAPPAPTQPASTATTPPAPTTTTQPAPATPQPSPTATQPAPAAATTPATSTPRPNPPTPAAQPATTPQAPAAPPPPAPASTPA